MHFGIVAGVGTISQLLDAISGRLGTFSRGERLVDLHSAPERDANGEHVLCIGELAGKAYIMDAGMLVSTDIDAVLDASRNLVGRVVAVGAETVSGSYWVVASDSGTLEWLHWNCLTARSEPYEAGSAKADPDENLEDIDGAGLMAVLRSHGFDYDAAVTDAEWWTVKAAFSDFDAPPGPEALALRSFLEQHPLASDAPTGPIVVQRGKGAFDMLAPGSRLPDGTIVASKEKGRGLIGRLLGR